VSAKVREPLTLDPDVVAALGDDPAAVPVGAGVVVRSKEGQQQQDGNEWCERGDGASGELEDDKDG
jgi:hypothetical protein